MSQKYKDILSAIISFLIGSFFQYFGFLGVAYYFDIRNDFRKGTVMQIAALVGYSWVHVGLLILDDEGNFRSFLLGFMIVMVVIRVLLILLLKLPKKNKRENIDTLTGLSSLLPFIGPLAVYFSNKKFPDTGTKTLYYLFNISIALLIGFISTIGMFDFNNNPEIDIDLKSSDKNIDREVDPLDLSGLTGEENDDSENNTEDDNNSPSEVKPGFLVIRDLEAVRKIHPDLLKDAEVGDILEVYPNRAILRDKDTHAEIASKDL